MAAMNIRKMPLDTRLLLRTKTQAAILETREIAARENTVMIVLSLKDEK